MCGPIALFPLVNCETLSSVAAPRSSESARICCRTDAHVGPQPARTFQAVTQSWSPTTTAGPGHCKPSHVTRPKQSRPAGSSSGVEGWVFLFFLYQDLAEIGCVLGKWVMFVQRFVNANRYASTQGYSRGLAGRASPRAHVRGALPAARRCSPCASVGAS